MKFPIMFYPTLFLGDDNNLHPELQKGFDTIDSIFVQGAIVEVYGTANQSLKNIAHKIITKPYRSILEQLKQTSAAVYQKQEKYVVYYYDNAKDIKAIEYILDNHKKDKEYAKMERQASTNREANDYAKLLKSYDTYCKLEKDYSGWDAPSNWEQDHQMGGG